VRNYGGDLEIARGASLLRNQFEVVLFRGKQSFQYLPYLVGVAAGFVERMSGCTIVRGRVVSCQSADKSDIYVQVDGELIGHLPVTAEIVPDSLTLLLPPEFLAKEQAAGDVAVCA
jgi:diacylglycerol kinase family enzyme